MANHTATRAAGVAFLGIHAALHAVLKGAVPLREVLVGLSAEYAKGMAHGPHGEKKGPGRPAEMRRDVRIAERTRLLARPGVEKVV